MTDLTSTHEPPPETASETGYPESTLSLRLDCEGIGVSWTLRGTDESMASRLPRVLNYIKRLQAKLPTPETARPTAVPAREIHDCEWHGPMRESTKAPGTFFCPKKKASGDFCPSRWPMRAGEQSA